MSKNNQPSPWVAANDVDICMEALDDLKIQFIRDLHCDHVEVIAKKHKKLQGPLTRNTHKILVQLVHADSGFIPQREVLEEAIEELIIRDDPWRPILREIAENEAKVVNGMQRVTTETLILGLRKHLPKKPEGNVSWRIGECMRLDDWDGPKGMRPKKGKNCRGYQRKHESSERARPPDGSAGLNHGSVAAVGMVVTAAVVVVVAVVADVAGMGFPGSN